jgi:hypothetical protein
MSIATWPILADFSFKDKEKAIELVKNKKFTYSYDNIDSASSIEDIFASWDYTLKHDGDRYDIISFGDCRGDEEELFTAIAPCVNDEGIIEIGIEFGEAPGDIVKVYKFNGGKCKIEYLYQEVDVETGVPTTRRPFNEEEFF